jgi:hypothetical protein
MSESFSSSQYSFETDTIANSVVWSKVDQIGALSTNTMDENENVSHHIHFVNCEVNIYMILNNYHFKKLIFFKGKVLANSVLSHPRPSSKMEWQPTSNILLVGWVDGNQNFTVFKHQ